MKLSNLTLTNVKYYFTASDIFEEFNTRDLDVSRKALQRGYGPGVSTKTMCCRVFIYFLYLIILDIIRNNVTFIFPTRKEFILGTSILRGEELLSKLRINTPKSYDYFGSGMTMPRINFFYKKGQYDIRTRNLVLNKSLTKEFFDNINNGKIYG